MPAYIFASKTEAQDHDRSGLCEYVILEKDTKDFKEFDYIGAHNGLEAAKKAVENIPAAADGIIWDKDILIDYVLGCQLLVIVDQTHRLREVTLRGSLRAGPLKPELVTGALKDKNLKPEDFAPGTLLLFEFKS